MNAASSSSGLIIESTKNDDQSVAGLYRLVQDPAYLISSLAHEHVDRLFDQGEFEAGRSMLEEVRDYDKRLSATSAQAFLAQKELAHDDMERHMLDMHRMGNYDDLMHCSDKDFEMYCTVLQKMKDSTFWEKLLQTNFEQLTKGDLNELLPIVLSLTQEGDAEDIKKSFEQSKACHELTHLLSGLSSLISKDVLQAMQELQGNLSEMQTFVQEISDEANVVMGRQIAFLAKMRLEHKMQQAKKAPKVKDVLSQLLANSKDPELTRQLLEQLAKK
jgi:hypothetical protein